MSTIVMDPAHDVGRAATRGPLAAAAGYFIEAYNARERLVADQRGWTRVIALAASDTGEVVTIRAIDGRLSEDTSAPPPPPDVVITSDSATLCDVLELRLSPNEPYVFGELTVRGAEADFLRIDYIAASLCPA